MPLKRGGGAPIGNKNAAGPRKSKASAKTTVKKGNIFSRAFENFKQANEKANERARLQSEYLRLNEKSKGIYAGFVQNNITKIPDKIPDVPGYPKISNAEYQEFRRIITDYGKL